MRNAIRGTVHVVGQVQTFGRGFRKRTVVLTQDDGQYTNYVPIDFVRDDCESVDTMAVGDEVEVEFELRGRQWQKSPNDEVKYFMNAEGRSWKKIASDPYPQVDPEPEPQVNYDAATGTYVPPVGDDDEEVPF